MSEETSEKRGRGRPKGSLNKNKLAKQEEFRQATTLDVSFDQEKDLEQEQGPEPEKPDVPEVKKPRPPRKPTESRASARTRNGGRGGRGGRARS